MIPFTLLKKTHIHKSSISSKYNYAHWTHYWAITQANGQKNTHKNFHSCLWRRSWTSILWCRNILIVCVLFDFVSKNNKLNKIIGKRNSHIYLMCHFVFFTATSIENNIFPKNWTLYSMWRIQSVELLSFYGMLSGFSNWKDALTSLNIKMKNFEKCFTIKPVAFAKCLTISY